MNTENTTAKPASALTVLQLALAALEGCKPRQEAIDDTPDGSAWAQYHAAQQALREQIERMTPSPELLAAVRQASAAGLPFAEHAGEVVFINKGDAEDQHVAHEDLACPHCGGSGHRGDVKPAVPGSAQDRVMHLVAEYGQAVLLAGDIDAAEPERAAVDATLRSALAAASVAQPDELPAPVGIGMMLATTGGAAAPGYVVVSPLPAYTAEQLRAAVAAEREACAQVCEGTDLMWDIDVWVSATKKEMTAKTAQGLADAIRARGASPAGAQATGGGNGN